MKGGTEISAEEKRLYRAAVKVFDQAYYNILP